MKVVILAGGLPSTISEDKEGIPKPMVEIGENPILWHIMKNYAAHGFSEFIICAGYKIDRIKDYFKDFYIYQSDITVDLRTNQIQIHKNMSEDWKVTVVDTGIYTATTQRINMIRSYITEDNFVVTNGDCLDNIDIGDMNRRHEAENKVVTMAVARPTGRNVTLQLSENGQYLGKNISEDNQAWTNTGTYIFHKQVFNYLIGNYSLEDRPMDMLAEKGQVNTYRHFGFWSPVETKRDKEKMQNLWNANIAPWKTW
ncbi:MAG: sugar phosphate nucleotidyltransferase [Lachnospiraceae bacterium]|nr:sugar phosphate nucleotidyltransferase [Lachnospiraceae bacterium]